MKLLWLALAIIAIAAAVGLVYRRREGRRARHAERLRRHLIQQQAWEAAQNKRP